MIFNCFKRGKRVLQKVFVSSHSNREMLNIPTRKTYDELEWEKCQKFVMEKPLLTEEAPKQLFQEIVGDNDTVEELKQKVSVAQAIPMERIQVSYEGNTLKNHHTFAFYDIDRTSSITITIRSPEN